MEIQIFPNSSRPGVGMTPRRDGQRPLLPAHARHCPVLEAGNAWGFLVYPPLEQNETFHIEYHGDGRYQVHYFQSRSGGNLERIFAVSFVLPLGGIGMLKDEVEFMSRKPPMSREQALNLARAFIVPADLGTPAGAVSLRGASNFQTPAGWDTVYTPIFNMIERPIAPMLVVRVETDWYAHDSEFRYILQPGEGIPGAHHLPIGQVVFVPREEVTFRNCTAEELAAIRRSREEFSREKDALKVKTSLGLEYSPHYIRQSRTQKPPST